MMVREQQMRGPGAGCLWTLTAWVLVAAGTAPAQPAGEARRSMFSGRTFDLLSRSDVKSELELLDDQTQKIEALRQKYRERNRNIFNELRSSGREGIRERLRKAMGESNAELEQDLGKILLPHQLQRFKQLQMQYRLRGRLFAAFYSETIARAIELNEQQQVELRTRGAEIEREYLKQLREIRNQAELELLKLLTPEQRAKFENLLGEPFEFRELSTRRSDPPPSSSNQKTGERSDP